MVQMVGRMRHWWRERAREKASLMGRLRRDVAGNTLAIAAAAMIPLIAMVGSAVDMSRAYLIKTRLQQACDAGALAARKSITGNALTQPAKDRGAEFFNINLRTGAYGVKAVSFVLTDVSRRDPTTGVTTATGTVHGQANATVPTTIMKFFGAADIPLTATCETELNVANNDIMFALDTTGSMSCLPTDALATCQQYVVLNTTTNPFRSIEKKDGSGANVSRIDALRKAVINFFNTVNTAQAPGTRLRIGFVPYSSGVNIGGLLPSGSMVTERTYDSRKANFATPHYRAASSTSSVDETWTKLLTTGNCDLYTTNQAFSQTGTYSTTSSPNPTGNFTLATTPTQDVYGGNKPGAVTTNITYAKKSWAGTSATVSGTVYKTCVRTKTTTATNYDAPPTYRLTSYNYLPLTYSLNNYLSYGTAYTGSPVRIATTIDPSAEVPNGKQGVYDPFTLAALVASGGTSGITVASPSWDGCIEERLTGSDDIDAAASSANTKWAPTWPGVTYNRPTSASVASTTNSETATNYWTPQQSATGYTTSGYFCPKAAQQLQVMTATDVSNYVNSSTFVPSGFTYHDIGMIWAARLMSDTSIFSANFGPAPNGKPITRHIIFMTDGDMETNDRVYSPYGIEDVDGRMTQAGVALNATHQARFAAACTAAKNKGVSVWVVAFGQALTQSLKDCATSTDQAFQATTAASLNTAFANIASRIADLRLTS
jgi:Flp pilus assembly protein TadG